MAAAASGISIDLTPWDERRKTYTSRDVVMSTVSAFSFAVGVDYAGGPAQTITAVKCGACGTLNGHTERCPRVPVQWDDHGDGLHHVNRGLCAAGVNGCDWAVYLRGGRAMSGTAASPEAAKVAAGERLAALAWAEPEMVELLDLLALLFDVWDRSPEVARARGEAELAKIVADCPEGLDPVGWRAAVLAAHEQCPDSSAAEIRAWLTPQTLAGSGDFACVYRRAIAPHKAPPPERKQRGPRLTVDDGRDE